jgi:hypothetical protein
MAGFPKDGNNIEIGHDPKNLPVPFPCLRAAFNNEGPGRNKFGGKLNLCPASRKELDDAPRNLRAE